MTPQTFFQGGRREEREKTISAVRLSHFLISRGVVATRAHAPLGKPGKQITRWFLYGSRHMAQVGCAVGAVKWAVCRRRACAARPRRRCFRSGSSSGPPPGCTWRRGRRPGGRSSLTSISGLEGSIPMHDLQLPIPDDNRILFFKKHNREIFGFLSNYHDAAISLDGETWRSSEFYYRAESQDPAYREAVRRATARITPKGSVPIRGGPERRKRSWFHGRLDALRGDWDEVKEAVMETAVRAKFHQNPQMRACCWLPGRPRSSRIRHTILFGASDATAAVKTGWGVCS